MSPKMEILQTLWLLVPLFDNSHGEKNKSDTDFPCSDLVLLFCFLPQYDLDLTSLYSLISCRQQ